MSFPPVPSAAPTSVSVSEVTYSSITVRVGATNCIHRNGDITGYSVQYGSQTKRVPGGGATQTTISGLTASTEYSIKVAAVNSGGTGVYSNVIRQLTQGIIIIILFGMTCTSFAHSNLPLQFKLPPC